jgi:hypothetical protein
MENKLEFYTSKRRMIKLIFICSIITLIGMYCAKSNILIINIIGVLNLIMGVSGIVIGLYNFIKHEPQLTLTESGINHKKITKKMIFWSEILNVKICKESTQNILVLELKGDISLDRFKYIFKKTAKSDLEKKHIKINIDPLVIDYDKLNSFLSLKLNKNIE